MVLIIEQFLLLILIMGRFMMPRVRISIFILKYNVNNITLTGLSVYCQSCWLQPSGPKHFPFQGEMTRDELAQLLLCYIGTAADIIEFFDSFKVLWNQEECLLDMSIESLSALKPTRVFLCNCRMTKWTPTKSCAWWSWSSGPGLWCSSPSPSTPPGYPFTFVPPHIMQTEVCSDEDEMFFI